MNQAEIAEPIAVNICGAHRLFLKTPIYGNRTHRKAAIAFRERDDLIMLTLVDIVKVGQSIAVKVGRTRAVLRLIGCRHLNGNRFADALIERTEGAIAVREPQPT